MAVDLDKLIDRARAARSGAGRIDLAADPTQAAFRARLDALIAKGTAGAPQATIQDLERLALVRAQYFDPARLRGLDLFAGAGGFTIGALQRGCPVIGIERAQRAVEAARAAGHDVLRMDVEQSALRAPSGLPMDVLIGGPPCQPFSSAGRRRGQYDPREGFGLALQAIDAWRPRRICLENVKDFLASRNRRYREQIFDALRQRYNHVGAWLLNARDFGVPQDRERVFIWAAEVPLESPEPTHGPGTGKPYVSVRQALPHLLDEGFEAIMAFQTTAVSRTTKRTSPTVTTARNLYAVTRQGFTYRGAGSVPKRYRRLLTPEEIQALQSFPATFGFLGNMKERATQIGNAVPPPLAAAVVAAVTVGLEPRQITPTELLNTFQRMDETIWTYEPRPWTDKALIGVTTQKAGAEGRLVPVYDSAALKEAVWWAYMDQASKQHGIPVQALDQYTLDSQGKPQRGRGGWTIRQQAETDALSYLFADKQSHYNPAAPVVVPTRTFAELGIPIATVLLPPKERTEVLVSAARRAEPSVQSQDDAWDLINEVLPQHDEILEF